ncbi:MAG: hypothetical protein OXI67_17590 [Candidatus Poribacteria bacterium]|nr:hypothetical protein [Candidatus Poribacteria bacterium]
MYRKHLRRNTLIAMLCCLLIVGSIVTTQAADWKWWDDPWYVSLWNLITGLKDTLEGIDALVAAFETDIKEAEDEIARQENWKNGWLKARNNTKEKIQADEQEQNQKIRDANDAAKEHSDASQRASDLRSEIEDLKNEIKWVSPGDPRHSEILAELAMKNSALATEEDIMSAAKKTYNSARSRVKFLENKLRGDRNYIDYLTRQIDARDRKIGYLNKEIEDIEEKIKAEKKRRKKVKEDIAREEAKWEKLQKDAKKPPADPGPN